MDRLVLGARIRDVAHIIGDDDVVRCRERDASA
jgi:hypothetical protein